MRRLTSGALGILTFVTITLSTIIIAAIVVGLIGLILAWFFRTPWILVWLDAALMVLISGAGAAYTWIDAGSQARMVFFLLLTPLAAVTIFRQWYMRGARKRTKAEG